MAERRGELSEVGLPVESTGDGASAVAALRRVLLNSVALLLAYVLPRLATFAAVVVAARAVGVSAFGAYGAAAALAVIFSITATLGMMQLLVRDLAQRPAEAARLMAAANVAKTGSGLLMLVALAVTAGILDYPPEVFAAALLLGLGYAVGSYAENLGAYFQAAERMGVWMQAQAVFGLVTGALGILLVLMTRSIVWFCAAPVAGQLSALGWLLFRAPAPVRMAWRAPWALVRRLLGSLLPFAAAFIALTAYYKVDILLVERWRGTSEAGLYAAAYKFVDIGQALALVLATAIYPRLARAAAVLPAYVAGRTSSSRWAASRVMELLLLAGVPAAALLWLLRAPVLTLLFGPEYGDAASVLGILAIILPVLALNALGTFILAAARRMTLVAGLYLGALVLNVGLNAVAIPLYGARGAALAMLVSESLLAVGMVAVLHRHAAAAPALRAWVAAGAAAVAAGLIAWPGGAELVAAGAYLPVVATLYWSARVVPARELSLLRRALQT